MISADNLDSYSNVVKTMPIFRSTKLIQIKLLPKLIQTNNLKFKLFNHYLYALWKYLQITNS